MKEGSCSPSKMSPSWKRSSFRLKSSQFAEKLGSSIDNNVVVAKAKRIMPRLSLKNLTGITSPETPSEFGGSSSNVGYPSTSSDSETGSCSSSDNETSSYSADNEGIASSNCSEYSSEISSVSSSISSCPRTGSHIQSISTNTVCSTATTSSMFSPTTLNLTMSSNLSVTADMNISSTMISSLDSIIFSSPSSSNLNPAGSVISNLGSKIPSNSSNVSLPSSTIECDSSVFLGFSHDRHSMEYSIRNNCNTSGEAKRMENILVTEFSIPYVENSKAEYFSISDELNSICSGTNADNLVYVWARAYPYPDTCLTSASTVKCNPIACETMCSCSEEIDWNHLVGSSLPSGFSATECLLTKPRSSSGALEQHFEFYKSNVDPEMSEIDNCESVEFYEKIVSGFKVTSLTKIILIF